MREPRCAESVRNLPPGEEARTCKRYSKHGLPVCYQHARVWANENPRDFLALRLGRVTGVAVTWVVRQTYTLEITLAVEREAGPPLVYGQEDIKERANKKRSGLCRGIVLHMAMDTAQVAADEMAVAGDSQSATMILLAVARGREMARLQATEIRSALERAGFGASEIDELLGPRSVAESLSR